MDRSTRDESSRKRTREVAAMFDEVAALFSAGTTIAPSIPVLVTAAFISLKRSSLGRNR